MFSYMIENIGEASLRNLRLMGMSTKKSDDEKTIGQFGSGAKYSFALLARLGCLPIIFLGETRVDLIIENDEIMFHHHLDKGTEIIPSSIHVNFGKFDWIDPWFAIRDLVSNALDEAGGKIDGINLSQVKDNQIQGEKGKTRIFIPLTPAIAKATNLIVENFIFDAQPLQVIEKIKTRVFRFGNNKIFKKGVFIQEVKETDYNTHKELALVFNYEFNSLKLNESRTADQYCILNEIGMAVRRMDQELWEELFKAEYSIEHQINLETYDFIIPKNEQGDSPAKLAWNAVMDKNTVICSAEPSNLTRTLLEEKGYKTDVRFKHWYSFLKKCGIKTIDQVLSKEDIDGLKIYLVGAEDKKIFQRVIDVFFSDEAYPTEMINGTQRKGRNIPEFKLFASESSDERGRFVKPEQYVKGTITCPTVMVNKDIFGENLETFMTIFKELSHFYSKKGDLTRDFQNYLIKRAFKASQKFISLL